MILAVCIDDKGGMAFNGRRQSQDRALRRALMERAGTHPVWMNAYSAAQFEPDYAPQIRVAENFLDRAGPGEFCFAETQPLLPYEGKTEQLLLFRWNRRYPADTWFDIPLSEHGWHCTFQRDFPGFSHETITQEVYIR